MSLDSREDRVSLAGLIAELDEDAALRVVRERAASGESPLTIIQECQSGMQYVGEHYESGKFFISGLIMAGEIFREAMDILAPLLSEAGSQGTSESIVLCTVQGDIHDLGKNIVDMLLRSYGFTVHDLGVDVAPTEVALRARELRPDLVGLSVVLTSAIPNLRRTVEELRGVEGDVGRPLPVIIGGGLVNDRIRDQTGADLWANDAAVGVSLIRETLARSPQQPQ